MSQRALIPLVGLRVVRGGNHQWGDDSAPWNYPTVTLFNGKGAEMKQEVWQECKTEVFLQEAATRGINYAARFCLCKPHIHWTLVLFIHWLLIAPKVRRKKKKNQDRIWLKTGDAPGPKFNPFVRFNKSLRFSFGFFTPFQLNFVSTLPLRDTQSY